MSFGYNPNWRTWKCPICKQVYHFRFRDKGEIEYMSKFLKKHAEAHSQVEPQRTLTMTPLTYSFEVKDDMKIPAEAIEPPKAKVSGLAFLKVPDLGLKLAETKEFTIIGDVEEAGTEKDRWYSVPVSYNMKDGTHKGQYRLNRTTLRAFVPTLGDDTANWIGSKFTAFTNMVNNPKTGSQQLGLTVLVDTVKRK